MSIQMEVPETNPFFSKSTCFVKSLHQWWTGPIHIRSFLYDFDHGTTWNIRLSVPVYEWNQPKILCAIACDQRDMTYWSLGNTASRMAECQSSPWLLFRPKKRQISCVFNPTCSRCLQFMLAKRILSFCPRKQAADVEHCLGNISTGNHFTVTYDSKKYLTEKLGLG